MLSKLNQDRGRQIIALKNQGLTYEEIAPLVNLRNRQRVEQVHKAFIRWAFSSLDNRKSSSVEYKMIKVE